ncbi:hypothetical protein Pelo_11593 [Pelomyxa schiedti]|nr:hypothetical protein Pelo_11593 [Pelomyxa schiedti]
MYRRNDSILLSDHIDSLAGRHRFQYQLQLPGRVQNLLRCPHIAKIELTIIGVPFKLEMEAVTLHQNTSTDSPCCCCRSMVMIMSNMGFSPTKEDIQCQPMPSCACDTCNCVLDAVPASKAKTWRQELLTHKEINGWDEALTIKHAITSNTGMARHLADTGCPFYDRISSIQEHVLGILRWREPHVGYDGMMKQELLG